MQFRLFLSSWCHWQSFFRQVIQMHSHKSQLGWKSSLGQSFDSITATNEWSNKWTKSQTNFRPTKRLGQDALLPGNLSSKRVLFWVSMMDDEIQSCMTHSEYTSSHQVTVPVPFVSFHSKSFGLAYCWVHFHQKTTADLFNAQHSIQFARSACVLISTFNGSTSSSRMACWVHTLTVKVPLLHQTNQTNQTKQRLEQDILLPLLSSIHQCNWTCNAFRMIAYLDFNRFLQNSVEADLD